jgi:hypothetical protein
MEPSSSLLTVFEGIIFDERDDSRQDIREHDPVNILLSAEDRHNLPAGFLKIADKLHQTYLDWKHRRNQYQPTQTTFYRYIHKKIERAAAKVAESGTPLDPPIFLILESKIAFLTLNSSLMAAQDYRKVGYLQDMKESVDTALSVLYELIKTREKLEPSLDAAVASIRQDITNDPETDQFVAYVATQISRLRDSISEPKLYIVRSQLDKLKETLTLLSSADGNSSLSKSDKLDDLMNRLFLAMVEQEAYTTTITHQNRVDSVSFSPDGTYLATRSRKTTQLVEVATGRVVTTPAQVDSVSFSPDGIYRATALSYTTQLVEVATGRVVTTIRHGDYVLEILFSRDGTYLATASQDNTAKLVEVATGRVVTTIRHQSAVYCVQFSPDGTYLATISYDKTIGSLGVMV